MVKPSGHVAGSSAREVVVASVKSTLGETCVHPKSTPPRTVAGYRLDCVSVLVARSRSGAGDHSVPVTGHE